MEWHEILATHTARGANGHVGQIAEWANGHFLWQRWEDIDEFKTGYVPNDEGIAPTLAKAKEILERMLSE